MTNTPQQPMHILVDAATGIEIRIGDTRRDNRGEEWRVEGFTPPKNPASTGRILVSYVNERRGKHENRVTHEYYPGVFNARIVALDGSKPLVGDLTLATAATVQQLRDAIEQQRTYEVIALNLDEARIIKTALLQTTFADDEHQHAADELVTELDFIIGKLEPR